MYYKNIQESNKDIVREKDNASIPLDDTNPDYQAFKVWAKENNTSFDDLPLWPPRTPEFIESLYHEAIEDLLDSKARERNYRNAIDAVTYIGSKKPKWNLDAIAFKEWRDDVYEYALEVLEKFESGKMPLPELKDFINDAPKLVWPTED